MIDFIEYVVSELKSKRLSKNNALSLIKQFTLQSSTTGSASVIHPLVHTNTSNLNQQSYSSIFTGEEFFLSDHRVSIGVGNVQKVLPGVAYLEMARVAVEQAMPGRNELDCIELQNIVWARPIIVSERKEVSIALFVNDHNSVEFEVYSIEKEQEIVHCQGVVGFTKKPSVEKLNIPAIKEKMQRGRLQPERIYETYIQMGINYGRAHQGISEVFLGENEIFAELNLTKLFETDRDTYFLHPGIMDSALQSAIGLIATDNEILANPSVPFNLKQLNVFSGCTPVMYSWVRYTPGSKPGDKVTKLDIDLCDAAGNVCVQFREFTSRILSVNAPAIPSTNNEIDVLYAEPTWKSLEVIQNKEIKPASYKEQHVILCDLPHLDSKQLEKSGAQRKCVSIQNLSDKNLAERYIEIASGCFELIKQILLKKPQGKTQIQLVISNTAEEFVLSGLSGMLKTVSLENPMVQGQVIGIEKETSTNQLIEVLQQVRDYTHEEIIKYEDGKQLRINWDKIEPTSDKNKVAFKDNGVYLITGGLGGLGMIFAKEILKQTSRGRVIVTGRSKLTADKKALLDSLTNKKDLVEYLQLDLTDVNEVKKVIASIVKDYKKLNGVLHSAGMTSDSFIIKKGTEEFKQVLLPKVAGTYYIDEATKELNLDFLVLFSSGVSVTGNKGQSDYAAANGFMDKFAYYRNQLVDSLERTGKTVSINWPYWNEGGIGLDGSGIENMKQLLGMHPMQTQTGLNAFYQCLQFENRQALVVEGDVKLLEQNILTNKKVEINQQPIENKDAVTSETKIDSDNLTEKTREYLRQQFSLLFKLPPHKIDPKAPLERYGINSIMAINLTNQLENTFGTLSKTLFFEYQTIDELTGYFSDVYRDKLTALFSVSEEKQKVKPAIAKTMKVTGNPVVNLSSKTRRRFGKIAETNSLHSKGVINSEPIAIIGLSGRYPEAIDLNEYWQNLRNGKDCIIEVPKERWDWREYYSEDRSKIGNHFSKWGGFIKGVDEFDPRFFNISPLEAELMDPQERLFLQFVWMAIEDAGYTREKLQIQHENDQPGQVGVYAGVMYSEYQMFGTQATAMGKRMGVGGIYASIANRISYTLNLHGPSMTLDTMCSSSITAIHLACQDLKMGRTNMAIAGGVNVSIHPNKYIVLSTGQFISSDGHCQSFGEGGDGYIPGEGVGVAILKRLSDAERDGDHIYGVIKGSALNHGGKTNGYTVPNPQSQASVINKVLAESNINARSISYIEAHGTGTKLGDPIEIAALSKTFNQFTRDTGYCLIGSAKSNIGHCEAAAGIAGVTKVLLQLKHKQIVPSLHSERLNPNIDFEKTPFIVNQTLKPWERPVIEGKVYPRIAGISSFGAGGSNAHIIIEEYESSAHVSKSIDASSINSEVIIPLSARTPEQLKQKARDLYNFIKEFQLNGKEITPHSIPQLETIAYTLQTGREVMDERLGFIVSSIKQLTAKLEAYLKDDVNIQDFYRGRVDHEADSYSIFNADADLQETVEKWIAQKKFLKLLDLWVKGLVIDWDKLVGEYKPQRISLPVYPFAKERYWMDFSVNGNEVNGKTSVLHPLVQVNTSDLLQQSYSSVFTGDEFFLSDHRVSFNSGQAQKVLPAVAYLEMVRTAMEFALPDIKETGVLEVRNTVWAEPVIVSEKKQVFISLYPLDEEQVDFEIHSTINNQKHIHCQGQVILNVQNIPNVVDIEQLRSQMANGSLEAGKISSVFDQMGIKYGDAFQAISEVNRGEGQLLSLLQLPASVETGKEAYYLHPSIIDSAIQASAGLVSDLDTLLTKPSLPFALESIRMYSATQDNMYAWIRYTEGSQSNGVITKVDIDLIDLQGNICARLLGFTSREIEKADYSLATQQVNDGLFLAIPDWQPVPIQDKNSIGNADFSQHHLFLLGMPQVDTAELNRLVSYTSCIQLQVKQQNLAERFSVTAQACFENIQKLLKEKLQGKVLLQIAIANTPENALLIGVSGLLKTATLENPMLSGQIITTDSEITTVELAKQLKENRSGKPDIQISYNKGIRSVLGWKEITYDTEQSQIYFKDNGVYLITGGLGALGALFANEILNQCNNATVIVTGRSKLNNKVQAVLNKIQTGTGTLIYKQLDLSNAENAQQLVAGLIKEHQQINGIIHSAGMITDNFILKKTTEEFSRVLQPKVTGTVNLDEATKDIKLDFFVLFSSVAGALGNLGQSDYATANCFVDQFSLYRNQLNSSGLRHGKTLSINWPYWKEGGMHFDQAGIDFLKEAIGVQPLQTQSGIQSFYRGLESDFGQLLVMEGEVSKIRKVVLHKPVAEEIKPPVVTLEENRPEGQNSTIDLTEKAGEYISKLFSEVLKIPSHELDTKAPLEKYGIDSILAMRLTNKLEEIFGSLSKTLFFEYQTIKSLAGYFTANFPQIIQEKTGINKSQVSKILTATVSISKQEKTPLLTANKRFKDFKTSAQREIAIVGLSGKYPLSDTIDEFWENLLVGRDCITEIPKERWDADKFFNPNRNQPGKSYSKWGGFINDVDKFDPLIFNISPKEAELTDPQERLFIETVWQTIEDAGYSKDSISAIGNVGVYVGVMYGQYQLYGAETMLAGNDNVPGSSYASVANRVSYFFDFHGPSIAIDTMCSSSLTAIHMACEEIRNGAIEAAIAGGVNLSLHPHKYLILSQGNFAASGGRCRSFGEGGDGYVAGEGIGAILLKPLDKAIEDGDHIYGVVKSSKINHGGKTNGYTVPNPVAQGDLIAETLKKAKIDPGTIGYIETHGTGTALGDPIEINGLKRAFEGFTDKKQFCSIGSVKSNIGHLESAAGIAAVTKALLQIKHKQIVPSLHAKPLNPNIDFTDSPFYVQTELGNWESPQGYPRRTAVSSFGAGGSNAHLIIDEFVAVEEAEIYEGLPEAFVLSARELDTLVRYAERMVHYLDKNPSVSLTNLTYTSQVGRTAMKERLVVIATGLDELKDKLSQWIYSQKSGSTLFNDEVFSGNVKNANSGVSKIIDGEAGLAFFKVIMETRDLAKVAKLWISGVDLDWSLLYQNRKPKRISLPTYPFKKESYWIKPVSIETTSIAAKNVREVSTTEKKEVLEKPAKMYYTPVWKQQVLSSLSETSLSDASVLVFDSTGELKEQLSSALKGNSIVWVKPGEAYKEIEPSVFTINPAKEEQYIQLVENLISKGNIPEQIIHHCSEIERIENKGEIQQQLENGIYLLFNLTKVLMEKKVPSALKIVSVFSGNTSDSEPFNAALAGFFKTLTLENPKFKSKIIEVTNSSVDTQVAVADKVACVMNELKDNNWDKNEIRYVYQKESSSYVRYIKELRDYTPTKSSPNMLPIKQKGTYLVSGAFGGLGFIFSEYLVKNYNCNLVLFGRSELKAEQEAKLKQLKSYNAEVIYVQADASNLEDMKSITEIVKKQFSKINGVIHAAGVNRDSFILKKTREEIESVLSAKVHGAINLDLATASEDLDVFILFSSIAGVMGNLGQCDYAFGNHFIDSFAHRRNKKFSLNQRSGKTLSINWPYWENGGMHLSQNEIAMVNKQTGMSPLPTIEGVQCLEEFLQSELTQGVAIYGQPSKIKAYIENNPVGKVVKRTANYAMSSDELKEKTENYLRALIGDEIKLDSERVDINERFEAFGIDSIAVNKINVSLENQFGALPKTLLYEYETIESLAVYLIRESHEELVRLFNMEEVVSEVEIEADVENIATVELEESVEEQIKYDESEPIAIIGVHGQYPKSENLDKFWENIRKGKDLVELVPEDRWDYNEYFDEDPRMAEKGKIYCKWGGFLDDVDKFDPHFFSISKEEADIIDPQERLFLQSTWLALEDAGYTRESLKKRHPKAKSSDVGVFVGVTTNTYNLLAADEWAKGNKTTSSAMPWSIANRVSYFFDFQGPSIPVDTACSSSIVAIHMACESLRKQECQLAVVGGVNLYLHPAKYHSFCTKRMVSLDGKCHSYGDGDDGFVPGEAVGTLIIKPLSKAIEDKDHIYATILGSAFEHSGRSNGYTAPNPNSQAKLINQTLRKANINPETITYIEGHGTGTQLGDSLEIVSLTNAFKKQTDKKQFCSVGSVKSNMGHSESASGVAGITKILMQMKHKFLVPSIHSEVVNSNIDFNDTPFYLQHKLTQWEPKSGLPRRALMNSFGAGGVNACILLEEFKQPVEKKKIRPDEPNLIILSAKSIVSLNESVNRLLTLSGRNKFINLRNLSYTLQVAREAMQERLAIVCSNRNELMDRLRELRQNRPSENIFQSSGASNQGGKRSFKIDETLFKTKNLIELAKIWVNGENIDWEKLYQTEKPERIVLPTYAFAKERCWITDNTTSAKKEESNQKQGYLHPLVSFNSSTLKEVCFNSMLSDKEFYSIEHQVNSEKIFPGSGFLEIAGISGSIASEQKVRKIKNIVWEHPLSFKNGTQLVQTYLKPNGIGTEYQITSLDDENERILHSEGKLFFHNGSLHSNDPLENIPIQKLKEKCTQEAGAYYYNLFKKAGLNYGPTFQTIQEFYVSDSFALSKIKLADHLLENYDQFILHPSMIDGALQTVAGLVGKQEPDAPYLPFAIEELEIIRSLPHTCYVYAEFVDEPKKNQSDVKKFNIQLLNENGDVLIKIKNFYARKFVLVEMLQEAY